MVTPGTADRGPARTRSTARRAVARLGGRAGRHEQPEQDVDDDAAAAGEGERDGADPPEQGVDAGVLGQAAGDAADHLVGAAAAQLRAGSRPGRRGGGQEPGGWSAVGGGADGGSAEVMP